MNTLDAFQMRCQRQILDVCWWAYVSNPEMLQRSLLSTIGDILRHHINAYLCLAMLHAWTLVPAHDVLRLMVVTYESWRRPPGRPRNVWLNKVQEDANALCSYLRCGDLRSPGATERRNSSLGLRDDDDDDEG